MATCDICKQPEDKYGFTVDSTKTLCYRCYDRGDYYRCDDCQEIYVANVDMYTESKKINGIVCPSCLPRHQ